MPDLCSHKGCDDREYDALWDWCEYEEQCKVLSLYLEDAPEMSYIESDYADCVMRIISLYTGKELNDPYKPIQLCEDRISRTLAVQA